jgi:hypothetical protein
MAILDTGDRTPMGNTGFVRDNHTGKGRMDLLPWAAIMELSKHCEDGAIKYGERNIDLGCPQHSLIDSAFRHLAKYMEGWTDEDHLRSALWNIAWAVQQDTVRPEMQDIPNRLNHRCVETTCYHDRDCICLAGKSQPESADACPLYSED